ncbi:Soluble guanylate cyclase 89Da, partial [Operophtera brumata]
MMRKNLPCPLPTVPASLLLQLFPFGVLFDRRMKVLKAGDKLIEVWGGPYNRIEKSPISEILRLRKPKVSFTWDKTMIFDLELMRWRAQCTGEARRGSQGARSVLLRGPFKFLEEIDALIFLCSPMYEMLVRGWQHLSRLELLFEKAESRSTSLEKSIRLLDQWKKRGDQLLYSMIPKAVADHLRAGKDPMAACQAFESVTIIFCGLKIAEAGSRADVMQTVAYMNDVYSRIDRLLDTHRVYKGKGMMETFWLEGEVEEEYQHEALQLLNQSTATSGRFTHHPRPDQLSYICLGISNHPVHNGPLRRQGQRAHRGQRGSAEALSTVSDIWRTLTVLGVLDSRFAEQYPNVRASDLAEELAQQSSEHYHFVTGLASAAVTFSNVLGTATVTETISKKALLAGCSRREISAANPGLSKAARNHHLNKQSSGHLSTTTGHRSPPGSSASAEQSSRIFLFIH